VVLESEGGGRDELPCGKGVAGATHIWTDVIRRTEIRNLRGIIGVLRARRAS